MTIEVSPAQAVEIAKLLAAPSAPAPSESVRTVQPTPVQTAPVQTAPVQTAPVQQIPHIPTAAPAAQAVSAMPAQTAAVVPPAAQTLPVASREYTMDELALAARPICEAGRQAELLNLLHSFTFTDAAGNVQNVQSIQQLPKESYPAFANGIRALGGKI